MPMCQSCGMPLSKDPQKGGTEKDGSKSKLYCSYCYKDGAFLNSFKSGREMQKFCLAKMKEAGMASLLAWLLTRNIPYLKRWKNKQQITKHLKQD